MIIVLAIIFLCTFHTLLMRSMFSFLCVNKPVNAKVLVIEGWLSDRMLKEAAAEFHRGNYSFCLVSGKPYGVRSPACAMIEFGLDTPVVKFTEAKTKLGHNTYYMALAARTWLQTNNPDITTLNIFTAGPHGRKSWTIMKRVFGSGFSIGVISSSIEPEDVNLWWGSIRGVYNMIKYEIGYIYAMVWPFDR